MAKRYDIKKESQGTWSVIDVFTGWPFFNGAIETTGIDLFVALELMDLLNALDRDRGAIQGPYDVSR